MEINIISCKHTEEARTYRTDVATLKEKGAWKDVDAETKRTDCVASDTGPSLTAG